MKTSSHRWVLVLLVIGLLFVPQFIVTADDAGSGQTLYLPIVSREEPVAKVGPAGGTFPAVAVDPLDASVVYVGTWGLGVQKSLDGGLTWHAANAGLGNWKIQSLAISADGGLVYAGTYGSGTYRSSDGGQSWTAINNGDAMLSTLIIYDIEIDPSNSQIVYISGRKPGACNYPTCPLYGYVFKSTNGGDSWTLSWDSWNYSSYVDNTYYKIGDYSYDVEVDPTNSSIVYLAGHRGSGVYKSTNGGASWSMTQGTTLDLSARKIAIDPAKPATLYNSTYQTAGVYKSSNGGGTWTVARTGLPASIYGFALEVDPENTSTLYLGTGDVGIYRSADGAANWTAWGLNSNFIWDFDLVGNGSAAVYAATDGNGLQFSSDGSAAWQSRNEGIFNTTISGLASFGGALYAGVDGGGVFKTLDQGSHWTAVISGLGNLNVQNLLIIEGNLYAVTTGRLYVLSGDGASWSVAASDASAPLEETPEEPSSAAPAEGGAGVYSERNVLPEEEQYLLSRAGATDGAVDGAAAASASTRQITSAASTWRGLWTGAVGGIYLNNYYCVYSDRTVYALHVSQTDGRLYASLSGDPKAGGFYVIKWNPNDSGCSNWDTVSFNVLSNKTLVYSFASTSTNLFAATSAGVYVMPKNASNWQTTSGISGAVYAITVDPTNASILYAAAESGAYFSADGGRNWSIAPQTELQGVAFIAVEVDSNHPGTVYFGSRDGSTYRWNQN